MRRFFHLSAFLAGALLFFAGCATRVPVTVTKPAEVNMASMRKVAVLGFSIMRQEYELTVGRVIEAAIDEIFNVSVGERVVLQEIEEYAMERLILGLVGTNYFHVVSGAHVRTSIDPAVSSPSRVREIGKEIGVQGLIVGEIYRLTAEDEEFTRIEEVMDPETDTVSKEEVPWIRRSTTLGLSYHVFSTDQGTLYASRSFEASLRDEAREREFLRDSGELYKEIVDSLIPRMMRQLAPYTVRESRKLMKDKSRDPLMKSAKKHARNGLYERALALYLEGWDDRSNPAAGFNGAIMYELTGDIDAAVSLMKEVVDRYPEKKILREYKRLIAARKEQELLAEQLM